MAEFVDLTPYLTTKGTNSRPSEHLQSKYLVATDATEKLSSLLGFKPTQEELSTGLYEARQFQLEYVTMENVEKIWQTGNAKIHYVPGAGKPTDNRFPEMLLEDVIDDPDIVIFQDTNFILNQELEHNDGTQHLFVFEIGVGNKFFFKGKFPGDTSSMEIAVKEAMVGLLWQAGWIETVDASNIAECLQVIEETLTEGSVSLSNDTINETRNWIENNKNVSKKEVFTRINDKISSVKFLIEEQHISPSEYTCDRDSLLPFLKSQYRLHYKIPGDKITPADIMFYRTSFGKTNITETLKPREGETNTNYFMRVNDGLIQTKDNFEAPCLLVSLKEERHRGGRGKSLLSTISEPVEYNISKEEEELGFSTDPADRKIIEDKIEEHVLSVMSNVENWNDNNEPLRALNYIEYNEYNDNKGIGVRLGIIRMADVIIKQGPDLILELALYSSGLTKNLPVMLPPTIKIIGSSSSDAHAEWIGGPASDEDSILLGGPINIYRPLNGTQSIALYIPTLVGPQRTKRDFILQLKGENAKGKQSGIEIATKGPKIAKTEYWQ